MFIIFVILNIAQATTTCTFTLKDTKTIGSASGAFDATFTTPATTSYLIMTVDSNWDQDSNIQIQSSSFTCLIGANTCTKTGSQIRCNSLSSSTSYTLSCSGMNNPTYTGMSFGTFKIDFYTSGGTNINDGCSGNKLTGFTTGAIQTVTLTPTTMSLNTQSAITFQFKLANILTQSLNECIQIEITGFSAISNDGTTDFTLSSTSPSSTQLTFAMSRATTTAGVAYSIYFKLTGGTSLKTHSIYVYSYRASTSQKKDELAAVTFTVSGGALTLNSITAPNKIYSALTTYTLSLTLANAIKNSDGYITFNQPNGLTFNSGTCQVNDGTNTATSPTCQVASSLITVSGFSGIALNSGTTIYILISFTNPTSSTSTITFQNFISYYSAASTDNYAVDKSSTTMDVTGYNSGIISSISLTPGSYKVGQTTSLQYSFTNINQILTGSIIDLAIPSEISYDTSLTCSLTVNSVLQSSACAITRSDSQTSQITLTLSATIIELQPITIIVNSIKTPYSFRPTTSNGFSLSIKNGGVQFDKNLNFGQLTMNVQSAIQITSGDRGSSLNGELTTYTLSLQYDTLQQSGTKLILQFSPNLKLGSVGATFGGNTVTCSADSINSKITITQPTIAASTATSLILTNIYNIDYSQSIIVTGVSLDDTYNIATTSNGQSYTFVATSANTIQSSLLSLTQDNYQLGEIDSYTFIFTIVNILYSGCTIVVTVPTGFKILQTDCTSNMLNVNGFTVSTCSVNSQVITITPATYTSTKTLQFKFNNLIQNPNSNSNNLAFTIQTFKGSAIMDQTTSTLNLLFTTLCDLPCRKCVTSRTNCLSCYGITITTQIYYKSNQCLDTCGSGQYSDSSNSCQTCPTNCIKCTGTACTECISDQYKINNNSCTQLCSASQYDYNGKCTDCDSSCSGCVDSSTKCTSCKSSTALLYQNRCLSECPTGIFQVGFTCVACTSPCLTCGSGPNICATCVNGYYFKSSSSTCVKDCGTKYYENGSECTQCVEPCNNCTSDKICEDCISNYYFLNNQCFNVVPNGYYLSGINLVKCTDECSNCKSETECTSCPANKYLSASKCIDACPDNYYPNSFVCYACDATCLKCTSSIVCTKCPDNQSQLSGKCYITCPTKFYSSTELQCLACQSSCATCTDNKSCATCPSTAPYFLNKLCVDQCQTNYYLDSTSTCIKCATECATCDKNGCLTCITNYKQLKQACSVSCPTGYQDLKNTGQCEVVTEEDQTTISNLQENKYIPVPFTIGTFIFLLSVIVAKIQKPETFIPGAAIGLMGLIVVGSWAVLILLQLDYILTKIEMYLMEGACGLHILFNLINLCVLKSCTSKDQAFQLWYAARKTNACAYIFLNSFSIASFTLTRFYFSRYFGFRFFKCKLSDVENMSGLNIINGLCALLCCLPALVSSALLAYRDELREQLFISSIDSFIVTTLFLILLIWETQKDDNFFEDVNYASVSQSHQVVPDFFQSVRSKQSKRFSFEDSFNNKHHEQEEEPAFPKIDESIEYKEINQSQYSNQPKQSKIISKGFTFKQQEPVLEKNFNRSQDEVVLQMQNDELSEPLSIGESQRDNDIQNQQKMTLEAQQQQALELQKQQEEQQRVEELKKQQEMQKQQEEQRKIEEERKIQEQIKQQEEQKRLEELKKQEEIQKFAEIQRLEEIKRQEEEQEKQAEIKKIAEEKEERIRQEKQRILELKRKQQEEEQERIRLGEEKKVEEERLQTIEREQIAEQRRIEKEAEKQRIAEELRVQEERRLAEEKRIQDERKIAEEKKIEEEKKLEEDKRIAQELQKQKEIEEQKIKQQEEERKATIEREEQERIKQEELRKQQEQEELQKAEDLRKLLEEQRLQEQREQEMLQQIQKSKSTINQDPEHDLRQEEIEDLKAEVEDLDKKENDKLKNIILVDDEEDDVGWKFDDNEEEQENIDLQMANNHQKILQKEVIRDDKNDQDDDWDVPTSGFMSIHPKSQLRKDQQIEEPVNPFQDLSKKNHPIGVDLFNQQSKGDSDEDWAVNQVSPSDFNILNQRFENEKHSITQVEKHKKFSSTGQNFQNNLVKRQTQPEAQYISDNESIDQQPMFDLLARNQLNNVPKKQNKGLDKIYLQRLQKKPQAQNQLGIQDIQF